MANMELLDLVVSFVENKPDFHRQLDWISNTVPATVDSQNDGLCAVKQTPEAQIEYIEENVCGTKACIAGWGAIISGWCQVRAAYVGPGYFVEEITANVVNPGTGEVVPMMQAAAREFGLSRVQAGDMFASNNTIEDIREMVEALRNDPTAALGHLRNGMPADTFWVYDS